MSKASDYKVVGHLGKGAYGDVALGQHKTTAEKVAIKVINIEEAEDDIDESGEDLSRSISGITVSLQIDCNTDKLQSILDELVAETDGHFEIQ